MAASDERGRRSPQRRRPQPARAAKREPHDIAPGPITKIEPTQRDPERISVFISGSFAFALPALVVLQRGLQRGQELDEEAIRELQGIAEAEKAAEAAIQFVAYRPRSEREVRDRLRRRAFSPEAIDYAVEKLRGWRYLDDRAFAEFWVENRVEHAPRGRRRLVSELRAKGVDRDVVGDVLEETDLNEHAAAVALARKRLASLSGLDEQTQRRRLSGFLARRGYGWDVVAPVLKEVLGEEPDDES